MWWIWVSKQKRTKKEIRAHLLGTAEIFGYCCSWKYIQAAAYSLYHQCAQLFTSFCFVLQVQLRHNSAYRKPTANLSTQAGKQATVSFILQRVMDWKLWLFLVSVIFQLLSEHYISSRYQKLWIFRNICKYKNNINLHANWSRTCNLVWLGFRKQNEQLLRCLK